MKKSTKPVAIIPMIIAAIVFLTVPGAVKAQSVYKLTPGAGASVKVLGSSNVHDWTMNATTVESQGEFDLVNHNLRSLSLVIPVTSLKSEHSSMDDRTYTAINAKKFPTISFKLTGAEVTAGTKNSYLIKAKGDLTIAGVTQHIEIDVNAIANDDNTVVTCTGSKKIQLTDYGIKPPTFMLGAMKVANDLTIQFNLIYKK